MSRSPAFRSKTEDYEFEGSPTKLTNPIARNPALKHHGLGTSWRGMSAARVGLVCFLQTNVTAAVHQEVLEHFLLPTTEQLFEGDESTFQHELAPAHNAKSTKTKTISDLPRMGYRSRLGRQTLRILIPSKIFGESRSREEEDGCYFGAPTTLEQLKVSFKQAWSSITPANCQRLMEFRRW